MTGLPRKSENSARQHRLGAPSRRRDSQADRTEVDVAQTRDRTLGHGHDLDGRRRLDAGPAGHTASRTAGVRGAGASARGSSARESAHRGPRRAFDERARRSHRSARRVRRSRAAHAQDERRMPHSCGARLTPRVRRHAWGARRAALARSAHRTPRARASRASRGLHRRARLRARRASGRSGSSPPRSCSTLRSRVREHARSGARSRCVLLLRRLRRSTRTLHREWEPSWKRCA